MPQYFVPDGDSIIDGQPLQITGIGRDAGVGACNDNASFLAYFKNQGNDEFSLITVNTRITNYLGLPYNGGNKVYGIRETGTGTPSHYITISQYGYVTGLGKIACPVKGGPINTDPIVIVEPPAPVEEEVPVAVTPPSSEIQYHYFTILNESYSKKIFGYYSGSASFPYLFNAEQTGSGEGNGDPTSGFVYLDKGAIGSDGTTDEDDSTKLVIDVQTSSSKETIINYLSTLSSSIDVADYGSVKISSVEKPTFSITYNISEINTHPTSSSPGDSILADGWFELGINLSASAEGSNPLSSSIAFLEQSASYDLPVNVEFFNDALLGYHEIELPGSGSMSFVAAIEQTGSLKSGSISEPFNTTWGVSEKEFLATDYYPAGQGTGYMWNDGYKAKHIKLNNISYEGDKLSSFIKKSEESNFVLYNPKNANQNKLYTSNGNYSEKYILDNSTRYTNYSHLKVDQLNFLTSFAVDSENFSSNDFNLNASGNWIIYATSSGTITHPTASTGIDKSIPQGYFPRTLATEQYFRGWDDSVYYVNGEFISDRSFTYTDKLNGFNSGSTEYDADGSPNYKISSLPFFIDATSSFITIESESIVNFNNQTNLVDIGPRFNVVGGGQQRYYYKEDTGQIIISGSEHIDAKKAANLSYNSLYDVELVSPSNNTIVYTTPEGFAVTVLASQSLWLSRGIANPGTEDGDLWKYNRHLHRPYKTYILTSTGSYIKGYSEELYGEIIYREGPYPVGPPANEFERVFIAYSSSVASDREDGIYTFLTDLDENVTLYASADLDYKRNGDLLRARYGEAEYNSEEYGQEDTGSLLTWETASLKVYKNDSILIKDTFHNISASIVDGITLDVTKSISSGGFRTGDKIKVSVEVENAQSGFNAAIVVNNYNLQLDAPTPPTSDLIPVTFDNALGLIGDCDPTINNIVGDRPNERLQDVDYSIDINHPINFDQIIKDEAVRATVPESNFTQLGFANQRYFGSSTTREEINEFRDGSDYDVNNKFYYKDDITNPNLLNAGKGPKLGNLPNVELNNSYISYFNKIVDPYPLVNGKTAYYVKYLVDESGTVFDPTLSDNNFSLFERTYQVSDYDSKPTRVKTSLQNIDEVKELSKLNEGISSTFKLGKYPVPILYSQTSSLGHTNNIILSGSPFYGTLGIGSGFTNFGMRTVTSQSNYPNPNSNTSHANLLPIDFAAIEEADISLYDNNDGGISTSSIVDGAILLSTDSNAENVGAGELLSDNYTLETAYTFYTSTMPARYYRGSGNSYQDDWYDQDPYQRRQAKRFYVYMFNVQLKPQIKEPTAADIESNYIQKNLSDPNVEISSFTLTIKSKPGTSGEIIYDTITIPRDPSGYDFTYQNRDGDIYIQCHSFLIESLIASQIFNETNVKSRTLRDNNTFRSLVGGGWSDSDGDGINEHGYGQNPIIYEWTVNFRFKNLKQGSGIRIGAEGTVTQPADTGKKHDMFMAGTPGGGFHKESYNTRRTFSPTSVTTNTKPVVKHHLTSQLAISDQNRNGAVGPYWRKLPGDSNRLYMSSSILNEAYAVLDENGNTTNGSYFVQAKLDYEGDINVVFPNTIEPDFIEFDPVQDPWSLEVGDEIRFENNENYVFTITRKEGEQVIIPPKNLDSSLPSQKLQIYVTPEVPDGINLDFFVVRRYKENKNFIILDQQMPYGFPTTGSLEPSSAPGILLPEHRVKKYDRNPDEVLKDLIEKRII